MPESFIKLLEKNKVLTVRKFAAAAPNEEKVADMIDASGLTDLTWGEKVAIASACRVAKDQMSGSGSNSAATAAPKQANNMPEGVEIQTRARWRSTHGFALMGDWQVSEDTFANNFQGLNAKEKSLFVPDLTMTSRRSDLSQKPKQGGAHHRI